MEDIKEEYSRDLSIVYLSTVTKSSQIIYIGVLLAVLIAFISLPLLKVEVSVQGNGFIQSFEDKYKLQAPVSGLVNLKFLKSNHYYTKGDTLLIIDSEVPKKQNEIVNTRLLELQKLKSDAAKEVLSASSNLVTMPRLLTQRYVREWQDFNTQLQGLDNKCHLAKDLYDRYKLLFDRKVVSLSEFEKYKYDYQSAVLEKNSLNTKSINQWQIEIDQYNVEEHEQLSKRSDLYEQQKLYVVRAPVNGTLSQSDNTQTGAYVFAGQELAQLSPDTLLTAVCYVKPADIGLIIPGQITRIQVDAFNYNQWGILEAKVIDISNDVIKENGQIPVFKVRCQLFKQYLKLKNGYKGNVIKGMSVVAHFIVTKRSIYQLLYDKMDNWLNPQVQSS